MPARVLYEYLPIRQSLETVTGIVQTRNGATVDVQLPSFLYQQLGPGARRLHPWGLILFHLPEAIAPGLEIDPADATPSDVGDW